MALAKALLRSPAVERNDHFRLLRKTVPSQGIEEALQRLGQRAWPESSKTFPGNFLLDAHRLHEDTSAESLSSNLKILYDHARLWAPGLDVPYKIPRVRISSLLVDAGQYRVDGDGWVDIQVSAAFTRSHLACNVILAHEACHHILDASALDDKRNTERTERLTDLAMFICGYGDIVQSGRTVVMQTGGKYASKHLGYLESTDYDFAYDWVVAARRANNLPGMDGTDSTIETTFTIERLTARLEQRLSTIIPDKRRRDRTLQHYARKHPNEPMEDLLQRIIEQYERDNR